MWWDAILFSALRWWCCFFRSWAARPAWLLAPFGGTTQIVAVLHQQCASCSPFGWPIKKIGWSFLLEQPKILLRLKFLDFNINKFVVWKVLKSSICWDYHLTSSLDLMGFLRLLPWLAWLVLPMRCGFWTIHPLSVGGVFEPVRTWT